MSDDLRYYGSHYSYVNILQRDHSLSALSDEALDSVACSPGYLSLLRQVQGGRVLEEAPPGATSNGYPQRSPVHPRRVAVTSAAENPEDEGCRVA